MSLAYKSPIVDSIIFNLIREVHYEKFRSADTSSIDSSIIPRVSERVILNRGFKESVIAPNFQNKQILIPLRRSVSSPQLPRVKPPIGLKTEMPLQTEKVGSFNGFKESILQNSESKVPNSTSKIEQEKMPAPKVTVKTVVRPLPSGPMTVPINLLQNPPNYGKLNGIIRDNLVTYIDCQGPNQNIIVTKNGRKQQTNISLTKEEIKLLLDNISSKTRIPLLTGVFRVSWDNFIINAVISDLLEPRFLIKRE